MKRAWILAALAFGVIVTCFFLIDGEALYRFNNKYQNNINTAFSQQDEEAIDSLCLPHFDLSFPDSTQQHFEHLIELLGERNINDYQILNTWQPAVLTWDEETFDARVKMHGKEPNFHSVGEFFSLKIKSEQEIMGQRKFMFIIYERVVVTSDRIEALGNFFELTVPSSEMITVSVNNRSPKLFFYEVPTKATYRPHLINVELENQKSPIINQLTNYEKVSADLKHELSTKKYSDSTKLAIYEAYLQVNQAIKNDDTAAISQLFDVDYLARFQCARLAAGFVNHGFAPENMLIVLDTTNYKFYPLLHRDFHCGTLNMELFNSWEPYYYEDVKRFDYELIQLISANPDVVERTAQTWEEKRPEMSKLFDDFDAIDDKHTKLFLPSKWGLNFSFFEKHVLRGNVTICDQTTSIRSE
jgi:hypothetical protein